MNKYYKNLKKIRTERGLTQLDIAVQLDTTIQQYHRYETGKRELPLKHAITLSYFYNLPLDYIFKP